MANLPWESTECLRFRLPRSRKLGTLVYQVAEDIRSKIESRRLRVGDQIGSHASPSSEYGVNIITIKKALESLVNEGLLFTRVGKSPFFSLIAQGVSAALVALSEKLIPTTEQPEGGFLFKDRIFQCLKEHEETLNAFLEKHFRRHLEPFAQ